MFEQKWAKIMQLSNAHQSLSFQAISKFLCCLVGKRLIYKTDIADFQNVGFAKKYFSNTNFFENFNFFLRFRKFPKKNGIYVLDHYIVHVPTKFLADIIFDFHLITLKRCCPSDGSMVPTHWGLAFGITTSSMSFYALPFLCGLVEKKDRSAKLPSRIFKILV